MRKLMNRLSREERGFTLIEMLVVIAIIGILLAVAAPKVLDSLGSARNTKAKANIEVIKAALEQFREEYGQYPADLNLLKIVGYVKQNYDFKNAYGYYYFYAVEANGTGKNFRKYVLADPESNPPATPTGDAAAPTDTTPPEGVQPGGGSIIYFGNVSGASVIQGIDLNRDGTVSPGPPETTTYADTSAFQYKSTRPDKNNPWISFQGVYTTEQD